MSTFPLSFPVSFRPSDAGVTTDYREDFVGRDLLGGATDYLGRRIAAGNRDFLGRGLTSEPHATFTAYAKGTVVYLPGGAEFVALTAGISAGTAPIAPELGATVVDGGVTWQRTE